MRHICSYFRSDALYTCSPVHCIVQERGPCWITSDQRTRLPWPIRSNKSRVNTCTTVLCTVRVYIVQYECTLYNMSHQYVQIKNHSSTDLKVAGRKKRGCVFFYKKNWTFYVFCYNNKFMYFAMIINFDVVLIVIYIS